MPSEITREDIESVFNQPQQIHDYVKQYPSRAPRTEYLEHNGILLGVKMVWSFAHKNMENAGNFTTDNAKGRLSRLGFSNFISASEATLVSTPASVGRVLETHKRVERAIWSRNQKLRAQVLIAAGFTCQACGLSPRQKYDGPQDGCLEGHHSKPMSYFDGQEQSVSVEDLTCLCANCHRMIHRMIASEMRSVSLEEFQATIKN